MTFIFIRVATFQRGIRLLCISPFKLEHLDLISHSELRKIESQGLTYTLEHSKGRLPRRDLVICLYSFLLIRLRPALSCMHLAWSPKPIGEARTEQLYENCVGYDQCSRFHWSEPVRLSYRCLCSYRPGLDGQTSSVARSSYSYFDVYVNRLVYKLLAGPPQVVRENKLGWVDGSTVLSPWQR